MRNIIFIASTLLLAACDEETKTVDYYLANKEEMSAKVAECRNNPGGKGLTPNCVNASAAMDRSVFSSKNSGMPRIQ